MRRLLIVDDEPRLLAAMSQYFSGAGYRVDVAADRERALELMRTPFDGVIVDLRLSGDDRAGVAVLRAARAASSDAALLLLTALVGSEAHDAGADVVLEKPVRLADLESALVGVMTLPRPPS